MGPDLAELSSLASSLELLARRVGAMAEEALSSGQGELAADLLAAEKALVGAHRRLARRRRP